MALRPRLSQHLFHIGHFLWFTVFTKKNMLQVEGHYHYPLAAWVWQTWKLMTYHVIDILLTLDKSLKWERSFGAIIMKADNHRILASVAKPQILHMWTPHAQWHLCSNHDIVTSSLASCDALSSYHCICMESYEEGWRFSASILAH